MTKSLLVIGAAVDSLGEAIAHTALRAGFSVLTAGVSGDEDAFFDVREPRTHRRKLHGFKNVVCTVGINRSLSINQAGVHAGMTQAMVANVIGPMATLNEWLALHPIMEQPGHFVFISSNSAHVARSASLAYCASKAALSMAIRCAARDVAKASKDEHGPQPFPAIYGYEPGWIDETPMSDRVLKHLSPDVMPHRIPSGVGLSKTELAYAIVSNLQHDNNLMNGSLLRLDGGDQ